MHFDANEPTIIWESSEPKSREVLYLEKNNTPLLTSHFKAWTEQLSAIDPESILLDLLNYLRTRVFDLHCCNRHVVETIVDEETAEFLPIELFIQKRAGVCRHFALAAYYFLEKAHQEQILPLATLEIVRKRLFIDGFQGRHAWLWLSLEKENRSFHFDPFWGIVIDSRDPQAIDLLRTTYGF